MKKTILLTLLLCISKIIISQTVINNIPDTIIHLLEKNITVESYCRVTIDWDKAEDNDIVNIQTAPLDRNDNKEVYLYENSNRIIKLKNNKSIKVIANEDFFLVKEMAEKIKNKDRVNNESFIFSNKYRTVFKFYLNSGKYIGAFKGQ